MTVENLQQEVVELFTKLCGDPDNEELAQAADRSLRLLDEALATADR